MTSKSRGAWLKIRLKKLFPWTGWLLNYKVGDLRYDIIAGLTVGCTMIPQSMAYAQTVGVSPEYGLYSSFIPQFVYLLFGTSKDASIGPSSTLSILLGQINSQNPYSKLDEYSMVYVTLLALTSGLILLLIGIFKLGFIVNLFSIPVISGFTSAAGFTIIASQLKSFFGLPSAPNDSPGVVIKQTVNVFVRWDQIKICDVAFGLSTLCFIMGMQYFSSFIEMLMKSRNKSKGGAKDFTKAQKTVLEIVRLLVASKNVFAFVFTTMAAYLLVQADPSFDGRISIARTIKPGLPEPQLPSFSLVNSTDGTVLRSTGQIFTDLVISIVIVPLMILLECFAVTKGLGRKNGYSVDATNELVALGLSNFIQSFFQGMPVTAAVGRSAVNSQCRVKTLLSSLLSASIVILALLLLTDVFYYIPKASLAGIMIATAYNLIDFRIFRSVAKEYWRDVIILTLTFLLCLFFDIAYGILICIFINMITFLRPIVRMKIYVSEEDGDLDDKETSGRITVVQLSNGMKYPSADKFLDRITRILVKADKHVVLDCRFFTGIDYTGLQAIRGVLLIAYKMGKHVIFTNMSARLQKKVEKIGLDHWTYADTVEDAVKSYEECSVGDETSTDEDIGVARPIDENEIRLGLPSANESSSTENESSASAPRISRMSTRGTFSITRRPSYTQPYTPRPSVAILRNSTVRMSSRQSARKSTVRNSALEDGVEWQKKQDVFIKRLFSHSNFNNEIPIAMGNTSMVCVESSDGDSSSENDDDDNITGSNNNSHIRARVSNAVGHQDPSPKSVIYTVDEQTGADVQQFRAGVPRISEQCEEDPEQPVDEAGSNKRKNEGHINQAFTSTANDDEASSLSEPL